MDYLRSCYTSNQRPYRDHPEIIVAGRWHFCNPGALDLGIPHLYAASVWDDYYTDTDSLTLGEVAQGAWYSGQADPRHHGQRHCGPDEWWRDGSPLEAEGTPEVDATGYPPCCGIVAIGVEPVEVRAEDGMPVIPFTSVLIIDEASGLVLESTGPNEATLRVTIPPPGGSVNSVDLTAPTEFTVTGGPITDTGVLALAWASQVQPGWILPPSTGASGPLTYRAPVKADFPSGLIEPRVLEWTATTDAVILRKGGTASGQWEHHASGVLGQMLVVTDAGGRKVAEWTTPTLSLITDAGSAAAASTSDFAPAVHTHTLAAITDAGSAAAADTTDFAPAVHNHTITALDAYGEAVLYPLGTANDADMVDLGFVGKYAVETASGIVVEGVSYSHAGSNTTSHTIALPDGSNVVGKLLLVLVSKDGTGSVTWPSGWSTITNGEGSATGCYSSARYRVVDGTEGFTGTGDTITVTGASEQWASAAYKIAGHDATSTPPEAAVQTASSGQPNPPSLTPSWGSDSNLWVGWCTMDDVGTISAYPAELPDNQHGDGSSGSTGAVRHMAATVVSTAASLNPSAFTSTNTAVGQRRVTLAVRAGNEGGGGDTTDTWTGLFRDATNGRYQLFDGLEVEPTTTVNTGHASYALAHLELDRITIGTQLWHGGTEGGLTPTLGTVVRRMAIYDAAGTLLGYIPIYDSIT